VAVIGCGGISHEHLDHLSRAETVHLAAVCDRSPALADLARDRYGAGSAWTDTDEMLAAIRPDVVHVLTPPDTHVELARRALEAGAHVICEKPLAPSLDETRSLLDTAAACGRRVVESRNLLFNDGVIEMDRRIAAGQVGEVREVDVALSLDLSAGGLADAGLRLPGGAAHDFLPHLAYLFLHFVGDPDHVEEVTGRASNLSGTTAVGIDHVDVLVRAARRRGRIEIAPDLEPAAFRLVVRGTRGSVETDLFHPHLRHEGHPFVGKRAPLGQVVSGAQLVVAGFRGAKDKLLQHGTYHGVPRMLDAVYEALSTDAPLPVHPRQMLSSARLIDQIVALAPERSHHRTAERLMEVAS
jgi:predicted dehydrogenase